MSELITNAFLATDDSRSSYIASADAMLEWVKERNDVYDYRLRDPKLMKIVQSPVGYIFVFGCESADPAHTRKIMDALPEDGAREVLQ